MLQVKLGYLVEQDWGHVDIEQHEHEQDIWSHAEAENTCMCGDKTGVL